MSKVIGRVMVTRPYQTGSLIQVSITGFLLDRSEGREVLKQAFIIVAEQNLKRPISAMTPTHFKQAQRSCRIILACYEVLALLKKKTADFGDTFDVYDRKVPSFIKRP